MVDWKHRRRCGDLSNEQANRRVGMETSARIAMGLSCT